MAELSKVFSVIWALHGFLGKASDWDRFSLPNCRAVDLYKDQYRFFQWASEFNLRVENESQAENILIGYSMGGRLALHALADCPDLWSKVILLSAHPGLTSEDEKMNRRFADEKWARRFTGEEWARLMKDWNSQPVLQNSRQLPRQESDYDRRTLAFCLREWSLAEQRNFRPLLADLHEKIVWLTGAEDHKFCSLAETLKSEIPQLNWQKIPGAGHRLIEEPIDLLSWI